MNAKLISKSEVGRCEFLVKMDNESFWVVVYLNGKGKFIDSEIYYKGDLFDNDEYNNKILDYLDKNWDSLTNS